MKSPFTLIKYKYEHWLLLNLVQYFTKASSNLLKLNPIGTSEKSVAVMQFKFIAPVVGLLLLSSTGGCTPTPPEEGVCVANNCFRALKRFSTEAIPFCAEFIAIPKETVTVTTVTPTV